MRVIPDWMNKWQRERERERHIDSVHHQKKHQQLHEVLSHSLSLFPHLGLCRKKRGAISNVVDWVMNRYSSSFLTADLADIKQRKSDGLRCKESNPYFFFPIFSSFFVYFYSSLRMNRRLFIGWQTHHQLTELGSTRHAAKHERRWSCRL